MPCPHNEITIVQRSQRQSAVAAAAYQSGEKLFCEYDQQVKHYPEKRGIVHNEILLPENRLSVRNAAQCLKDLLQKVFLLTARARAKPAAGPALCARLMKARWSRMKACP